MNWCQRAAGVHPARAEAIFVPDVRKNHGLDLEQLDSLILHKGSSGGDGFFEVPNLIDLG